MVAQGSRDWYEQNFCSANRISTYFVNNKWYLVRGVPTATIFIQHTVTIWIPDTWKPDSSTYQTSKYRTPKNQIHLKTGQYGCLVFKWLSHKTWLTVQIPDILNHKLALSVWFSGHYSNARLFDNWTQIYPLNTVYFTENPGLWSNLGVKLPWQLYKLYWVDSKLYKVDKKG